VVLTASVAALAASPTTRTVYDATLKNGFTIHHVRHEVVGEMTRLYTSDSNYLDVRTADIADMTESEEAIAPEAKPQPTLNELVNAAGEKHEVDPDFIASVIKAESGGNPKATSAKGAQGLMQLMPGTASQLGVKDAYDPAANVNGGTQYLRDLLIKYNGDAVKALAAYNAGPGRVAQYHGVPPYHETRAYVARIIKDYNKKKLAAKKTKELSSEAKSTSGAGAGGK